MATDFGIASAKLDEDFSIIERLADAIRTEEDVKVSKEDRDAIVQDLYEGPKKCQCCINWMTECPHDIDLAALNKEEGDDDGNPLVVRRRVTPGNAGSVLSIHSIEIRHAAARKVLIEVFDPYDGIVHDLKYLIFLAPFHQFFWRRERFERAVAEEQNTDVKKVLVTLKWLVKRELAEAFAVSKELISHGVINYKYLWTLFPPGETIYSDDIDREDRFYVLEQISSNRGKSYSLSLGYVDWGGYDFGTTARNLTIFKFDGTRAINTLIAFPAKYLDNLESMQKKLTERGRKFADLAGMHYKAYRPRLGSGSDIELRVMIDASHSRHRPYLHAHFGSPRDELFMESTGLITQAPVDTPPVGGHIPLPDRPQFGLDPRFPARNAMDAEYEYEDEFGPRRAPRYTPPPPGGPAHIIPHPPPRPRIVRRRSSVSSFVSDASSVDPKDRLTDFHFQLCNPWVMGYDLKAKSWKNFEVDRIKDIEWNTKPFESLVLPDGYKDLILAFVESQVKEKDTFDDVINGKGGGLVALLAGDPGVGKTLTAESVAEKIQAPLFKMDLSDYTDDDRRDRSRSRSRSPPRRGGIEGRDRNEDFTTAFELAARWGALLLIDECDTYLEKRSDASSKRNRMVSRFLKELEYYPSLLFLTTNRERALDPAIYSRIHLTINYPALDKPSRLKIWQTFLGKDDSNMSDAEFEALSKIEVNGRRIRNIVKTASIMAKRENRTVLFEDVRKVMKITEGLEIEGPVQRYIEPW